MDYKEHTKQRFKQRFKLELTDEDYFEICNICRSEDVYFKQSTYKKGLKMVIKYKNIYMWCVLSHKSKIVKTVYKINKRERAKLINCE